MRNYNMQVDLSYFQAAHTYNGNKQTRKTITVEVSTYATLYKAILLCKDDAFFINFTTESFLSVEEFKKGPSLSSLITK